MVKDNNTSVEWMIGIDGLRPPGQICYGYLTTFRSLVRVLEQHWIDT